MATASTSNLPAIERYAGDPAAFVRDRDQAPLPAGPGPASTTSAASTASWPPARPGAGLRMVKDGRPLPPSAYTKSGRVGSRPLDDLAGPGKVFDQFAGRATIVLQSLHRSWAPLTAFCLPGAVLHPRCRSTPADPAVLTGPGRLGTHDVFVLQVHGRKLCERCGTRPCPSPGPQRSSRPGPSRPARRRWSRPGSPPATACCPGFRHAARTAETASLHLTVGMLTYNWNELLRQVVELATEEAWFRRACR